MKSRILDFGPDIEKIVGKCRYCSLAMIDLEGKPYVIHMNFGFRDKMLYLHAAPEGKKIDILKKNPEVCVAFSTDHMLRWQNIEVACSYTMKYRSVLMYGRVEFVEDIAEKENALNIIMNQYTDEDARYSEPALRNVCVFKVKAEKIEGRAFGY
jgi:uncharacterized protein